MRQFAILLLFAGLAGCTGNGSGPSTCEVLSPPDIILPTTQDDQRVEAQSTGDPTLDVGEQQNCP
ncbi:hypothetical protein [Pseudomonas subflava]|uniref:hypothetical protein n=1 Tax=Pseudomonas subflava TaxID=2952933 RepID=UPI00207AFC14|nr:hypothetical protein [Pseudomonas subflava]